MTFGPGPHAVSRRNNEIVRHRNELPSVFDVDVTTHGQLPGATEYAQSKIGELGRFTHRPVLHARVKLTRHYDPAVERPVVRPISTSMVGSFVPGFRVSPRATRSIGSRRGCATCLHAPANIGEAGGANYPRPARISGGTNPIPPIGPATFPACR